MIDRLIGVFTLNANTFEDIEHDTSATTQAIIVVTIVAVIGSLGNLWALLAGNFTGAILGFLGSLISIFIGWAAWAFATFFIGTSIFGGKADFGEMLRVTGFAYAPQVLGIIPCVGWIIGILWTAAAMFVAVRQGLDLDNGKTIFTVIIGAIVAIIIVLAVGFVVGLITGGAGMLGGALTDLLQQP